jgi:hypothetical protein
LQKFVSAAIAEVIHHLKTWGLCEYGGSILYSCMKIEQQNLLKLFSEGGREEKGETGRR